MISARTGGDARERAMNEFGVSHFVESAVGSLAAITRARARQRYWETEDAHNVPELLELSPESQRRLVGMAGSMALQFIHTALKHQTDFLRQNRAVMPYPSLSIFRGPIGGLAKALELRPTNLKPETIIKLFAEDGAAFRHPEHVVHSLTQTGIPRTRHRTPEAKVAEKRRRKRLAFDRRFDELRNDPEIAAAQALELPLGETMLLHEGALGQDKLAGLIAKYTLLLGNALYAEKPVKEEGRTPTAMEIFAEPGNRLFPKGLTGSCGALTMTVLGADAPPPSTKNWDSDRMPLSDMRRLVFLFNHTFSAGTRLIDGREIMVYLDYREFGGRPHIHVRRSLIHHTQAQHAQFIDTVTPLRDGIIPP
jgi:hypothetical protein